MPALLLCFPGASAYSQSQNPPGPAPAGSPVDDEDIAKDASTEINVKDADIAAIIRIFSRKTKRNYILDERVKGKVSIYLPGKVSADESLRILDSVLALKGFTSVPIGENLWKIVPAKEAKQSTIPVLVDEEKKGPSTPAVVTRLIPLKYVNAEDIQQLMAQLISPDGLINAYTGTNSLIVVDSEDNINRLVEIINAIDVPSTDRDMTLIPIKFADAVTIAEKLNEILGTGTGGKGGDKGGAGDSDLLRQRTSIQPPQPGMPPQPGAAAGAPTGPGSRTVSARGKEPKITADERTNSVIVIADEETTARVKALISQLDTKTNLSGFKFYVYRCEHAKADELAQVLSGLSGGGGGTTGTTGTTRGFGRGGSMNDLFDESGFGGGTSRSSRSSMGLSSSYDRGTGSSFGGGTAGSSRSRFGSTSRQGTGGPSSVMLGENVSITADPATNSLIIVAGKSDYEKILSLLKELDIKRRQVIVEAMLLEVSVDESLDLTTNFLTSGGGKDGGYFAEGNFGTNNIANLFDSPAKLSGFTTAAASSGTLTLPNNIVVPSQLILVRAISKLQNANVLSAPTILATDNEAAKIIVGQNVPFLASTSTSEANLNNTFNQIDRQDVGISLEMKPQISSSLYVTMSLYTEVSAIVPGTQALALGPTTTKRQSETTVIAKDGQMIVIGGLISDDTGEAKDGVPFLSDIPVLGHLFRSVSEARSRKNLLIFITPRIVKDQYDARDVTYERKGKMQDEIEGHDVFPERRDVLENRNMDKVTEVQPYEGSAPSTILPPESQDKESPAEPANAVQRFSADSPGVVELKVHPRLPGAEQETEGAAAAGKVAQAPAAGKVIEAPFNPDLPGGAARYVVMELQEPGKDLGSVPFTVHGNEGFFGVVIPEDAADSARNFFSPGNPYAYKMGSKTIPAVALGVFRTKEEAESIYPSLASSWYTMSPFEIMGLGKGPWIRESAPSLR